MTTQELIPAPQAIPVAEQKAQDLVSIMAEWHPHPTKVKLLIERAASRILTDSAISISLGLHPNTASDYKRKDGTLKYLWNAVQYDEEMAVLLLAYLTTRGAYATMFRAVTGDTTLRRANVQAAQSVIELAERRRRAATGPNPMLKALEEAIG